MKSHTNPLIKQVKKIKLPEQMIPLIVDMDEYNVVMCEKDEAVLLFTCGLSTCIGIAAFCRTKDGRIILGMVHNSGGVDSINFKRDSSFDRKDILYRQAKAEPGEIEQLMKDFYPSMLNNLIDTMKRMSGGDEIIEIYMTGCTGIYPAQSQLYSAYINSRKDLKLCDVMFDSYKRTDFDVESRFTDEVRKHFSVTFGITSAGEAILTKKLDLDDIRKFQNNTDVINYCIANNIQFPPNKDLVSGFETLTWDHLYREDHEYDFNPKNDTWTKKNMISKQQPELPNFNLLAGLVRTPSDQKFKSSQNTFPSAGSSANDENDENYSTFRRGRRSCSSCSVS